MRKYEGNITVDRTILFIDAATLRQAPIEIPKKRVCSFFFSTVQCFRLSIKYAFIRAAHFHAHQYGYIHRVNVTLLINDYQFNINSISMYYNQTILNSDRYSLYITIIKSDNNMTTEALKHYKGEKERERDR